MRTPKCSSCGGHAINQSELWPTLWMCGGCRVTVLRQLTRLGVTLSNNPLIHEICVNTHYFERESFRFWMDDTERYVYIDMTRLKQKM